MKSLQLTKPHLLVVVGLPGSGKTFFAKQFSDTFNAPYIDYGYYSSLVGSVKTSEEIIDHIYGLLLRTKQSLVIEGRGSTKAERKELADMAAKNGYSILFVWVQTEPATAEHRAVYAKTATMNQKEFDKATKAFENLNAGEPYMVISGKHTFSSQGKTVLRKLITDRPTTVPASKLAAAAKSKLVVTRPASRTRVRGRINVG